MRAGAILSHVKEDMTKCDAFQNIIAIQQRGSTICDNKNSLHVIAIGAPRVRLT